MELHLIDLLRPLLALTLGGLIGLGFGLVQQAAHRRHEQLQEQGRFKNAWAVLPGSGRRVAYLLVALVLSQLVAPALFADASAWWVSAGVAGGYGALLFRQLWQKRAELAAPRLGRARSAR